jgi:hypothetical protein
MKARDKPHYVNNKDFSQAVVDYCKEVQAAKQNGNNPPIIPDYIAQCFLRIAEGLSHKANFVRYTYREEMVMDAVENCLKAIDNFNVETKTRTGLPNAFSYFTQISWYAFLRRIQKEKKQQDIKMKYMTESTIGDFIQEGADGMGEAAEHLMPYVELLRTRIDDVKRSDQEFKEYAKEEKKRTRKVDSDLSDFFE